MDSLSLAPVRNSNGEIYRSCRHNTSQSTWPLYLKTCERFWKKPFGPNIELREIITRRGEEINEIKEFLKDNLETTNEQIDLLLERQRLEQEQDEKAQTMNAIHDFVHCVERMVCRRLNVAYSNLNCALKSNAINWIDVRTLLDLEDEYSSNGLLATINQIRTERLGCGHALPMTARKLVLSKDFVLSAKEVFLLSDHQVDLLGKLLDWAVQDLPESATLVDLKRAAE
ncbi:hypothetical protein MJO28_011330 [Puccinia striiformis f. sp. tritici]|uniref:Uncharacterized protein n=4 Tax=Puccinia striiformis TaxID=27350 RepID=A0A0L0W587_9BASI|nr:hypothetical protein Pst134EB_021798 [Puccinia striiformis f. sp. tritici]KAI9621841.1 hypothetical protein KEM48_007579 [Puccinia striiformis f. sp. tritici PST-130]KNF06698.1 hypothetical protein PSTG_00014 [Puccinia striiformis f. sp. tritici PST-78]POW09299.1 hypothetical protein PSHT_09195 [Puccinia striiformis]KAI7943802.1 hypothetical protein MJO28_011330 [Puccinia striiformis f. sp. tritici]